MPYKIQTGPKAILELTEILNWYATQQEDLPQLFRDQYQIEVFNILRNPESYQQIRKGYRHALMEIFPYFIVYSINKKEEIITIISIFHTSRHPKRKLKK